MLTMTNMAKMTIATHTPVAEAVARSSLTASSSATLSAIKTVVAIVTSSIMMKIIIMINMIMIIICILILTVTAQPSSRRRLRLQVDNPGDLLRSILIVLGELITGTIPTINIIMHQLVEHPGYESEAHNSHDHHQHHHTNSLLMRVLMRLFPCWLSIYNISSLS